MAAMHVKSQSPRRHSAWALLNLWAYRERRPRRMKAFAVSSDNYPDTEGKAGNNRPLCPLETPVAYSTAAELVCSR